MRLGKLHHLSQRGDTIVEVLISIAVLGVVLGGAFVTTNRSLQATRDAQERVNALKLVESQLEQIKNLAATNPDSIFGSSVPGSYCISNNGTVVVATNVACAVDADGNPSTTEPVYHLAISRNANTFTVRNVWASVRGDTQNNVEMVYRVYE